MSNKILIIGNGFDLNFGLETSYMHFLKSPEFSEIKSSTYLGTYLWRLHKEALQEKGWVDVENELSNYLSGLNNRNAEAFKLVNSEYKKLKSSLHKYLLRIQDNFDISEDTNSFNIIKYGKLSAVLDQVTPFDSIFTFNYTYSAYKILNKLNSESYSDRPKPMYHRTAAGTFNIDHYPTKINFLHGSLHEKNIIFGAEDTAKNSPEHSFLFKTYHSQYRRSADLSHEIERANEVHFFGCALGITDSTRFKPVFMNLSEPTINRTKKKIIVFNLRKSDYHDIFNRIRDLTNNRASHFFHNCDVSFIDLETHKEIEDEPYFIEE